MTWTFHGEWALTKISHHTGIKAERFVIVGSSDADGAYGLKGNLPAAVSGESWTIRFETAGFDHKWDESPIGRFPSYSLKDGLVFILRTEGDSELVDLFGPPTVVMCRSLNPVHAPLNPITNPYRFTYSAELVKNGRRRKPKDRGGRPRPVR